MDDHLTRLMRALLEAQNAVAACVGTAVDSPAVRSADQHIREAWNVMAPVFNQAEPVSVVVDDEARRRLDRAWDTIRPTQPEVCCLACGAKGMLPELRWSESLRRPQLALCCTRCDAFFFLEERDGSWRLAL